MLDGHVDLRMELELAEAMCSCSTTESSPPASGGNTPGAASSSTSSTASMSNHHERREPQSSALALACAPILVKRQWGRRALQMRRDGRSGGLRVSRRSGNKDSDNDAVDVAADVVSEMMTNIFHKLLGQSGAHAIEAHLDADCLSVSLESLSVREDSRRGALRISSDSGVRKGALLRSSGIPTSRARGIRLAHTRVPSINPCASSVLTDATSFGSIAVGQHINLYGPPRITFLGMQNNPVPERLPPYNVNLRSSCGARLEAGDLQESLEALDESTGPTAALPLVSDDEL